MLDSTESGAAFLVDLAVAVAGALPDISTADVIIPSGSPLAQFRFANSEKSAISTLGAVLAIKLPFTINTTKAVNNYLDVRLVFVLISVSYLMMTSILASFLGEI